MSNNEALIAYLEGLVASMENMERAADRDDKTPIEGRFDKD